MTILTATLSAETRAGDDRFTRDPLVSHSGQFPLARPADAPRSQDVPSSPDVRPWNLRGMTTCVDTGGKTPTGRYDHGLQCSVDSAGRRLIDIITAEDPSAESTSDNDGDEGRSEDWRHDFAPDSPPVQV